MQYLNPPLCYPSIVRLCAVLRSSATAGVANLSLECNKPAFPVLVWVWVHKKSNLGGSKQIYGMRRGKVRKAFIFALMLIGVSVFTMLNIDVPSLSTSTASGVDLHSPLIYEAPPPTLALGSGVAAKFEDKRGTIEKLQSGGFDVNMLYTKKGFKVRDSRRERTVLINAALL
jgi:hypothetical protein